MENSQSREQRCAKMENHKILCRRETLLVVEIANCFSSVFDFEFLNFHQILQNFMLFFQFYYFLLLKFELLIFYFRSAVHYLFETNGKTDLKARDK